MQQCPTISYTHSEKHIDPKQIHINAAHKYKFEETVLEQTKPRSVP